jgi:hypothetical protein
LTTDVLALPEARYQSKARRFAWPFSFSLACRARSIGPKMTETYSKSRQRAEIAFGNVQTQFFAKNQAAEELESDAQSQQAKTLRLREARLAREQSHRMSATSALIAKRARAR